MRTQEEILDVLRSAFKPRRCQAEAGDFKRGFRLLVLRPDDSKLIEFPGDGWYPFALVVGNDAELERIVKSVRRQVEEEHGFKLDPLATDH